MSVLPFLSMRERERERQRERETETERDRDRDRLIDEGGQFVVER